MEIEKNQIKSHIHKCIYIADAFINYVYNDWYITFSTPSMKHEILWILVAAKDAFHVYLGKKFPGFQKKNPECNQRVERIKRLLLKLEIIVPYSNIKNKFSSIEEEYYKEKIR